MAAKAAKIVEGIPGKPAWRIPRFRRVCATLTGQSRPSPWRRKVFQAQAGATGAPLGNRQAGAGPRDAVAGDRRRGSSDAGSEATPTCV